jgi:hypothetical protein
VQSDLLIQQIVSEIRQFRCDGGMGFPGSGRNGGCNLSRYGVGANFDPAQAGIANAHGEFLR